MNWLVKSYGAKRTIVSALYVAAVALRFFGHNEQSKAVEGIANAFGLTAPVGTAEGLLAIGALVAVLHPLVQMWRAKPSLNLLIAVVGIGALSACSIINPPPAAPYVCSAPAPPAGKLVKVKDPAPGDRVIVVLRPRPSTRALAVADVQAVASSFSGLSAVKVLGKTLPSFAASASKEALAALLADPNVAFVQQVGIKSIKEVWNIDRIDGRTRLLDGKYEPFATGKGTHFFSVDTGVNTSNPEFEGRVGEGHSAMGDNDSSDGHGHGSHTSATAVGKTFGVAREAIVHACKALDAQGSGTDETVSECINWTTDICVANGWKCVGNMSLGGGKAPALDATVCASIAKGVFWAVAAGNDGSDACNASPADTDEAFTAAASDRLDAIASFSNRGPCVDCFAPGVKVSSIGGDMDGTSMSTPHVAGAALLVREKNPDATPKQVSDILLSMTSNGVITGAPENTRPDLIYVGKE